MTKARKKPAGAPTTPVKKKQESKKLKLTAVQLDKFKAVQQKELAFQNELVAVRTQKTDLLEIILDAHGYTKDDLSKVTNIILNEADELEVT